MRLICLKTYKNSNTVCGYLDSKLHQTRLCCCIFYEKGTIISLYNFDLTNLFLARSMTLLTSCDLWLISLFENTKVLVKCTPKKKRKKNWKKKIRENTNKNFSPLQSNANVKSVDHEGRTCISYARTSGSQELVDLLLNNGCPDVTLSGTLPRRKNSISAARKNDVFDKVTSSVL